MRYREIDFSVGPIEGGKYRWKLHPPLRPTNELGLIQFGDADMQDVAILEAKAAIDDANRRHYSGSSRRHS